MSFWGATVITSLASAIPVVGDNLVTWLWGGLSVDLATLNRFFSLHYLLPVIILGSSIVHIGTLHHYGSSNPLGIAKPVDAGAFFTYFILKDLVLWLDYAIFFAIFVFLAPNMLGHPDNSIEANPLVTPAHIVPEWYFLAIYAILRSIPNKLAGVITVLLVFVTLVAVPFVHLSQIGLCSDMLGLWSAIYFLFPCLSSIGVGSDRLSTNMCNVKY